MSFTPIGENSAATPGLFNTRLQELDTTISQLTAVGTTFGSTTTFDATVNVVSPAVTHNLDVQGGNLIVRQGMDTAIGMKMYGFQTVSTSTTSFNYLVIEQVNALARGGLLIVPGSQITAVAGGRNNQIIIYGVSGSDYYERFGMSYFAGEWIVDSTAIGTSGVTRPITLTAVNDVQMLRLNSTGSVSIRSNGLGVTEQLYVDGVTRGHGFTVSGSTGTVNLNQGRLLSVRTIAAGASATSANVAVDEICFQINAIRRNSLYLRVQPVHQGLEDGQLPDGAGCCLHKQSDCNRLCRALARLHVFQWVGGGGGWAGSGVQWHFVYRDVRDLPPGRLIDHL